MEKGQGNITRYVENDPRNRFFPDFVVCHVYIVNQYQCHLYFWFCALYSIMGNIFFVINLLMCWNKHFIPDVPIVSLILLFIVFIDSLSSTLRYSPWDQKKLFLYIQISFFIIEPCNDMAWLKMWGKQVQVGSKPKGGSYCSRARFSNIWT